MTWALGGLCALAAVLGWLLRRAWVTNGELRAEKTQAEANTAKLAGALQSKEAEWQGRVGRMERVIQARDAELESLEALVSACGERAPGVIRDSITRMLSSRIPTD